MNPDITVIVPIYNVEKYIRKCLGSLKRQTYKNFEVWAIDDGSPDNSKKIVQEYADKDPRFKSILKENGGYGSVLEYGIKNTKTKYFLVCDPDDWLTDDALEKLHNFAENSNLDVTVGDKYNIYSEDNKKVYIPSFKKELNVKPRGAYDTAEKKDSFIFSEVSPHAKLFKTSIAKNIDFPHKISYTDTILYVLSIANAKRVGYLDEALAYYLIDRPGNTMTAKTEAKIRDTIKIWHSIYNQLINGFELNQIETYIYFLYYEMKIILITESQLPSMSKYHTEILKIMRIMQRYNKILAKYVNNKVVPYNTNSMTGRLIFKGFMNKATYKWVERLYVKLERKREA